MPAAEFLETVALPNIMDFELHSEDMRRAVNCILTLDAFFGVLAAERGEDDGDLRKRVASENKVYALLRDAAFSIKHGSLSGKTPRLVRSAEAISKDALRFRDDGVWNDDDIFADPGAAIFIAFEHAGRTDRLPAIVAAKAVLALAKDELAARPLRQVDIADVLDSRRLFG